MSVGKRSGSRRAGGLERSRRHRRLWPHGITLIVRHGRHGGCKRHRGGCSFFGTTLCLLGIIFYMKGLGPFGIYVDFLWLLGRLRFLRQLLLLRLLRQLGRLSLLRLLRILRFLRLLIIGFGW